MTYKPVPIPVNGNLRGKYDEQVFALAEQTPGEWGIVYERVIVGITQFNRRYGPAGFEFTSRTAETHRTLYGRYVGSGFDRDDFYNSLDPHRQRYGKVRA